jgi:alcohol dehydrogenase (cytochrome c)
MPNAMRLSACIAALLALGLTAAPTNSPAQQTIAPASTTPVPGPMPDVLARYAPVTAERLRKPEDQNWLPHL